MDDGMDDGMDGWKASFDPNILTMYVLYIKHIRKTRIFLEKKIETK
jgi:hypothetical protein